MTDVERQYDYDHKWPRLLFYAGSWALCAVICGYQALAPGPAIQSVAFWISCAMSVWMLGVMMYLIGARCCFRHRLAFTQTSLLVPMADWSSEELDIDYQAILGLSLRDYGRFLEVTHTGGKYRVIAWKLPSRAAFREVCELLTVRAPASQQGSRAEPNATDGR